MLLLVMERTDPCWNQFHIEKAANKNLFHVLIRRCRVLRPSAGVAANKTREPTLYQYPSPHQMTPQQSQARYNRTRARRRITQLCIGVLCIFILLGLGVYQHTEPTLPPTYQKWHEQELELPQHNTSLPFPEGATGRYLYFSNRYIGQHHPSINIRIAFDASCAEIGWGNYMQEALMNAYLAEKSDRALVGSITNVYPI